MEQFTKLSSRFQYRWVLPCWVIMFIVFILRVIPGIAQEDETREVVIRTSLAEYDEETGFITARGESTITWQEITLISPYLEIDTIQQEAKSSGDIRIVWGNKTVRAQTLYFSGNENRAVLDHVNGDSEDMQFSAGQVTFDFTAERVSLTGNPLLTIREFEMRSDTIRYGFTSGLWEAIPVRLTRQDWVGQADRGIYREGEDFIELSGNARVEREGSLLQGEKVTVFTESGRVRVEGNVEITIMD